MPQIDQLPQIFGSQLFWLLVVFGVVFFGVALGMLPRIQSVAAERERNIAEDQELAELARAAAETLEADWRARVDQARAEANRMANAAKQASIREGEARVREAVDGIDQRTDLAIQRIRDAVAAAREEMDLVATDAAREIVERLVGIKVDRQDAAEAVAAELNDRSEPLNARLAGQTDTLQRRQGSRA